MSVSTASSQTRPIEPPLATRLYFYIIKVLLRLLLPLRYRVKVEGLKALQGTSKDARPLLFLPSHSALVDPLIMYSLLADFRPRALADSRQVGNPIIKTLVRPLRPLVMPDMLKDGRDAAQAVRQVLDIAAASLAQGDTCLLYPAGRLTRDGLDVVGGNSGAFSLYSRVPECRVVLVRMRGLWGSSFSYAPCNGSGGKAPNFFRALFRGFGKLCANGLLFMPRREVRVVLHEAANLPPPEAGVLAFNQVLEAFYQAEAQPIVPVRGYFWRGLAQEDTLLAAAAPQTCSQRVTDADYEMQANPIFHAARSPCPASDPALQQGVFAVLAAESGVTNFSPSSMLAGDLGIDSLSLVTVALQLEERFGHPIPHLERLRTVQDCLCAAAGQFGGVEVPPTPNHWHGVSKASSKPLELPAGATIPQIFFQQVRTGPQRLLLGDASGALTRKEVVLRALALAAALRSNFVGEERLGIMLPASNAATVVWLAVQLAGKTPVMINWTTGERNFRHCRDISGVRHVLTARKLMQRLEQQGFSPAVLDNPNQNSTAQPRQPAEAPHGTGQLGGQAKELAQEQAEFNASSGGAWVYLEDMAAALALRHKLWAALQTGLVVAGFGSLVLPKVAGPKTGSHRKTSAGDGSAAILFTSGSESRPKAVPLSHANILANCHDIAAVLGLHTADSMLGMLPPFHSLGLTGNIVVPLVFGMPVVYHPNPTEAAHLNTICRTWRPSMTVSPPTFLESMLHKAQQGDVQSLRIAFVGAEKCPKALYEAFSAHTGGGILCEGYGVTECAPGVCANPPTAPRPGTIGVALPSVTLAVVVEEGTAPESPKQMGQPSPMRRAAPDEQGMLLIAGPNVFAGYLSPVSVGQGKDSATAMQPDDPFVTFEGRRWYRSGDLVSADAQGHLTFRGRLKRFVKIGGEMLSLPQMEELLLTAFESQRQGREGPLLALESQEVDAKAVIYLFTTVPLTKEEANAALRAGGLSGLHAVHCVREVGAIPVLGSGKTDYQSLKALLVA